MSTGRGQHTATYQIRAKGQLDPRWARAFEDLRVAADSNDILIFTGPEKLFASLAQRPRWLDVFLVLAVLTIANGQVIHPLLQQVQIDNIRNNERLSPEQANQQIQRMEELPEAAGRGISAFFTIFGLVFWLVVAGAALLFGGNILLGGEARFKQIVAIVAHASWISVAKMVVTTPLMLSKGSASVSTSLAVLLPAERWFTPTGVILGAVDLFNIWTIVLLGMGLAAVYGFSKAKSTWLVVSLYVAMTLLFAGLAFLVGSLVSG